MEIIGRKLKDLTKQQYYVKHLEIINPFLNVQLTAKKIDVLATFMSLEVPNEERFSTENRKKVRKKHNLSFASLSNYIDDYTSKKILSHNPEGNLIINELLFPEKYSQGYKFQITRGL